MTNIRLNHLIHENRLSNCLIINVIGAVLLRVATGKHIDVSSRDDIICTLHRDDDRNYITLYNYKEKQFAKIKSFPSPSSGRHLADAVALRSDVIYISDFAQSCIYTISMDGILLGTHGRCAFGPGGAGELLGPRALATDEDDNLLVCDFGNGRLQVMTRDGEWHIVRTDKAIVYPSDVVINGDNVYVLCEFPGEKMVMYHI